MRDAFYTALFSDAVQKRQARIGSADHYREVMKTPAASGLGEDERQFLHSRTTLYIASIGASGYPYIQHRGGPAGFIHVLDDTTLAFADYRGNKQYISAGNIDETPRVSLFAMDYPRRARLKLIGEAQVRDAASDPELAARLSKGMEKFAERITTVNITGFDWNCPKYITQRFDENEMAALIGPRVTELTDHIAQLEARLTALDPNWKDTT
jgi:predicted pyridoxine 5'-phosphate oxidase superfamily flavin-nucleotide-binding protein